VTSRALISPIADGLFKRTLTIVLWLSATLLVGFFAATQSLPVVLIVLVAVVCLVCAMISPLAGVVVLLILAPMRTLIATEAPLQLPLDIGQIAFICTIGAWVIVQIARGERLVRAFWSPLSIIILFYVIVAGFTVFGATSVTAWLNEWLKWIQILTLITLVFNSAGECRWEWLLFGLTVSALANACVGIYEFFGGSGALHLLVGERFFRAFGTFGQPNPFGGFMGLVAPLTIVAMLGYSLRAWKQWRCQIKTHSTFALLLLAAFYGLSSAPLLIAIIMSWSRGAWIGLAAAMLIVALALPRDTKRGILFFGGIFAVIAVMWLAGVLPRSVVDRLSSSTQEFFAFEDVRGIDITPENYAVAERLAHWQAAINMATARPWLGVGLGNYDVVYPQFRLINWYEPLGHAHNYYLNILAETGIIGLLVYGKVCVIIMALSWRSRQHPDPFSRLVAIGLLGSWSYLAVHSFFDNLYVNNLFLHLGLMLGILAVLYNQSRMFVRVRVS
jgi:putative inorganic carbon (hco3(-)) transporter